MNEGTRRLNRLHEEAMHIVSEDRLGAVCYAARRAADSARQVEKQGMLSIDLDAIGL